MAIIRVGKLQVLQEFKALAIYLLECVLLCGVYWGLVMMNLPDEVMFLVVLAPMSLFNRSSEYHLHVGVNDSACALISWVIWHSLMRVERMLGWIWCVLGALLMMLGRMFLNFVVVRVEKPTFNEGVSQSGNVEARDRAKFIVLVVGDVCEFAGV